MSQEHGGCALGCGGILVIAILINVGSGIIDRFESGVAAYRVRAEQKARERAEVRRTIQKRVIAERKRAELLAHEQKAREEAEALELKARKESERKAALREEKLRNFTLKEAPVLWTTYRALQTEITGMDKKILELRETLESFGRNPDVDADFKRINAIRTGMAESLRTMRMKIEDAYLASCKYEATPRREDYNELRRRLLEDGILEAESAIRRFSEMRNGR